MAKAVRTLSPVFDRLMYETGLDALDYVCGQIEEGVTHNAIAKAITTYALGIDGITRYSLRRYLDVKYGAEEVDRRFMEAARKAAPMLVEDAQDIVDNADPSPETGELPKAREQAKIRLWRAERSDRDRFGSSPKGNVNINVTLGSLHLDALRNRASIATATPSQIAAPVDEAEVILDSAAEA